MPTLSIIFAGSGDFGVPTLTALMHAGLQVAQVVSQPDRPAGRGRDLTPTPIARFAEQQALPLVRTTDINALSLPHADAMVVIAFGQKISQLVANAPRLGSINLHASLLPRHRGAAPVNWAIMSGDRLTGNSVIRLAEKMDAGDILGQSQLVIGDLETAGELHERLADDGASLVPHVLEQLQQGVIYPIVQDHSQATLAPKLSRQSALLDWCLPAPLICRLIHGLYPWPACRVRVVDNQKVENGRLALIRAHPSQGASGVPGSINHNGHVCTIDQPIEILEVQPEGKHPMSLSSYRNGHSWQEGMSLVAM